MLLDVVFWVKQLDIVSWFDSVEDKKSVWRVCISTRRELNDPS